MAACGNCGAENEAGHRFCSNCGNALNAVCPNCEAVNDPSNNFCFNCGTSLTSQPPPQHSAAPTSQDPVADAGERRLVSVVFADLVGYTSLSESRDPEDVRSMLTLYYDRCREIIGRYGGTTDKFIGDAVMGVWGAVEANEDDAERATRAALELVDMVSGLGAKVGVDGLSARAGVLSGEASVGSGGNLHVLVVGDLVNTASRLQSIAPPGGVFVGETTRDLVGTAVEFGEVGEQTVKGKEIPVRVYRAKRVLALSARRKGGDLPDGPFVGRDDELRLLKDQLHATGRESRARMVSVIGEGGIGKTRLSQELLRYIDGITEGIYYHSGRSPSYGEGVTFWALGEMIRQRAGILEGEEAAKSRIKLRTMVSDFAPAEDDQRWIEPRLAALIGLTEMPPGDRSELFAALRAFFQAIATRGTVLMVFEDLHWADEGLLDFIEELVERTTGHPILVLCLARPELLDRRPDWAASRKRTLSMHLSRLDDESMRQLVAGLAPGMSEEMVDRIAGRTAGVPLHAVEFVRMLLNTGDLVRDGERFRFVGSGDELAVPDTVNAIISARLDRLEPPTLDVIKDASVLGLTFNLGHLARVRGVEPQVLEQLLRELVRREVFELEEDPRSPERGHDRVVQSLIREVAYGRLSRQERVDRHLEVASLLEEAEDPELAMVVASHYGYAVDADPSNEELAGRARDALLEAAKRAESLRSDAQAASLYARAAEMSTRAREEAMLTLEAARCLGATAREDRAVELATEALDWFRSEGDSEGEMRAVTIVASIFSGTFDSDRAAELIYPVYEKTPMTKDPDWAHLAQETARALMLSNRRVDALAVADAAIPVMEELEMVEDLLNTMISKASALGMSGRWLESSAVLRGVAQLAKDRDLVGIHGRALNNLLSTIENDTQNDVESFQELDRVAHRIGSEAVLVRHLFFSALHTFGQGDLEEARAQLESGREYDLSPFWADAYRNLGLHLDEVAGGWDESRGQEQAQVIERFLETDDPQLVYGMRREQGRLLRHAGDFAGAVALSERHEDLSQAYPALLHDGIIAAALDGDAEAVNRLTAIVEEHYPRGRMCKGLAALGRALGDGLQAKYESATGHFVVADQIWSVVATPYDLAVARGLVARVVGVENPIVAEKADQARAFFENRGLRLYLEGPMALVEPVESSTEGVAV